MKFVPGVFFIFMLSTCSDQNREDDSSSVMQSNEENRSGASVKQDTDNHAAPLTIPPVLGSDEPALSEYRTLEGDHSRDDQIAELIVDAKAHKYEALIALGTADIEQEALIQKIKQEITWERDDPGFLTRLACLAKLGDQSSYDAIVHHLSSGNYVEQEAAVDSLAYIGDQRSYSVLRSGLDDMGSPRQPFNPKEIEEPESALVPPVRFSCLRVLDLAFPGSGIPDEPVSWTQKDIDVFKKFYDNRKK